MTCEVYKQLNADARSERERFASPGYYKHSKVRGTSKAKLAREAEILMAETSNLLLQHVGSCEVCRSDRELILKGGNAEP